MPCQMKKIGLYKFSKEEEEKKKSDKIYTSELEGVSKDFFFIVALQNRPR